MGGNTYLKQANNLLKTLPAEDVSSFVASLMAEDPDVVHRFLGRFGPFDYARARDELLQDLREAEYEHSEYHGFINWRHTVAFETTIQQIVDARVGDVLAHEDYDSALSLGFEVYRFLTDVDMDDTSASDGDLLEVLDDTWDAIFKTGRKRGDDTLLGLLFDRLNSYTQDSEFLDYTQSDVSDWVYDKQCKHIKSFLLQRFCALPAHAPAMQALVDEELSSAIELYKAQEAASKRAGTPLGSRNHYTKRIAHWVLARVRCMEATGASYDERIAFAKDYLFERDVCLYFVDAAERAGDYAEAMRLVEACLDNAREKDELAPDWILERAVVLYEHEGDNAAVRNALEQLVVSGAARQDAPEWLRKLRGLYDANEWPAARDRLLSRVTNDRYRWRYYVEEELFDRLMDEIEAMGVPALRGFEEFLAPRYPERVLAMYRKDLLGQEEGKPPVGSTRHSYAQYASQVKHVRSIPGGSELADEIVEKVLELYPRRPALRSELSRA